LLRNQYISETKVASEGLPTHLSVLAKALAPIIKTQHGHQSSEGVNHHTVDATREAIQLYSIETDER
jgi:hypothetical protein